MTKFNSIEEAIAQSKIGRQMVKEGKAIQDPADKFIKAEMQAEEKVEEVTDAGKASLSFPVRRVVSDPLRVASYLHKQGVPQEKISKVFNLSLTEFDKLTAESGNGHFVDDLEEAGLLTTEAGTPTLRVS